MQAELVKAFAADVAEVDELFESAKSAPVLSSNAPPHAGAVAWVRGLKARLSEPFGKLQAMEHGALLEGREGKAASMAYAKAMAAMETFEQGVVAEWCEQVRALSLASALKVLSCMTISHRAGCLSCMIRLLLLVGGRPGPAHHGPDDRTDLAVPLSGC